MKKLENLKKRKILILGIIIFIIFALLLYVLQIYRDPFPRIFTEWTLPQKDIFLNTIETKTEQKEITNFYQDNAEYMYVNLKSGGIYKYNFKTLTLDKTEFEYLYQAKIYPYDFKFKGTEIISETNGYMSTNGVELTLKNIPNDKTLQITKNDKVIYELNCPKLENGSFYYNFNKEKNQIAILESYGKDGTDIIDLDAKKIVLQCEGIVNFSNNGMYLENTNSLYKWDINAYNKFFLPSSNNKSRYQFYENYILNWHTISSSSQYPKITLYDGVDKILTKYGTFLGIINGKYYSINEAIYSGGYVIEEYDIKTTEAKDYNFVSSNKNDTKIINDHLENIIHVQEVLTIFPYQIAFDKYNNKLYIFQENIVLIMNFNIN